MEIKEIIQAMYAQARELGCCDKFTGKEDLAGICALLKSPQGVEFCCKFHFPNMATLRLFKPYGVERFGIYIDAGNITLSNPESVVLVGRTSATVNCDTNGRHKVVLLHGAKAILNASRWAVIAAEIEAGCACIKNTSDHAIVI